MSFCVRLSFWELIRFCNYSFSLFLFYIVYSRADLWSWDSLPSLQRWSSSSLFFNLITEIEFYNSSILLCLIVFYSFALFVYSLDWSNVCWNSFFILYSFCSSESFFLIFYEYYCSLKKDYLVWKLTYWVLPSELHLVKSYWSIFSFCLFRNIFAIENPLRDIRLISYWSFW